MNDFDLKKYLAEGRLLKENMQDADLLASQAIDILDEIRVYAEDEELIQYLNKSMDYLERIPSNDDVYSAIQAVADGLSPYTGEAFDYEVDDMQSELERLIAENKLLKEEKRSIVDYDNRDGRTTELFLDNGDSVEVDVIELYNEIRKNNEDLAENKMLKERYDKESLLKALGDADDAFIQLSNGRELVIYNPNSNNDENADMWNNDVVYAVSKDGNEVEVLYSDIAGINL